MFRSALVCNLLPNFHDATNFTAFEELCQKASPICKKKTKGDLNQTPYDYTVEVTSRFKGLDLIDRMPEELWTEVLNIVWKVVIETISKKKKCKKAKWLSEEILKIVEKRKVKGKGVKERYIHLDSEFQRIARRDKKAFLVNNAKK